MGESQSRYGIMEELNNRKINEKEKLTNIEKETDEKIYQTDKEINNLKTEIENVEKTYEQNHKDWVRQHEVARDLFKSDSERKLTELDSEILFENTTYEGKFKEWKASLLNKVSVVKENLERYKTVQTEKIKKKSEVIKEIEQGITSLKEMSSEQGKDK